MSDDTIEKLATAIADLIADSSVDPPQVLMALGMVANEVIFEHWPPHLQVITARVFSQTLHASLADDAADHITH